MTDTPSVFPTEPEASFRRRLDAHGYGFQHAVLAYVGEWADRTLWYPVAQEVPVEVRGESTRIDFVLERARTKIFLVCECKRANPALSRWCFARARIVDRPAGRDRQVIAERVARTVKPNSLIFNSGDKARVATVSAGALRVAAADIFHHGVAVRTGQRGDERSESGDEIERAVSQVLRGTNGLVQLLQDRPELVEESQPWFISAVVFTTAELFTSDVELEKASRTTGEANWEGAAFRAVPWLAMNYNLSPGIKHTAQPENEHTSLAAIVHHEYTRTVFIVGPDGIRSFLDWSSDNLAVGVA